MKRLAQFLGIVGVLWLLGPVTLSWLHDSRHLVVGSTAALASGLPALVTLGLMLWLVQRTPEAQVIGVLASVAIRLGGATILGGIGWWCIREPGEKPYGYLSWILVFYLATLITETCLVPREEQPGSQTHSTS